MAHDRVLGGCGHSCLTSAQWRDGEDPRGLPLAQSQVAWWAIWTPWDVNNTDLYIPLV